LSARERLKNGIERVILLPVRLRHRRRARLKHKVRAATLETVRCTLEGATALKSESARTIFNVGLFLLLLDQDLALFTDDMVYAIGDRRRAFIAKHEAVLLYEAAEDLPQLLGRDFRTALKALGASEQQVARLNRVSSELNRFWQEHREFLGAVRNTLGAHREHDALAYFNCLELLKPFEVMARAAELSARLGALVSILTDIAKLTTQREAILRDIEDPRKNAG
jgi:hypothetical protein